MPVTGSYMVLRVRHTGLGNIRAYGEYIQQQILPVFENIDAKADAVASAEWDRLVSQSASDDDYVDLGDFAETAQDKGISFYETLSGLRQSMINLFAVGLFHLLEQETANLCRDGSFLVEPPGDSNIDRVADWYRVHFLLDLRALPSWCGVNELRLVANTVKHGEGNSAERLRALRPELFLYPITDGLLEPQFRVAALTVSRPLAGDDLYVTPEILRQYYDSSVAFMNQISEYFQNHRDDYFPR